MSYDYFIPLKDVEFTSSTPVENSINLRNRSINWRHPERDVDLRLLQLNAIPQSMIPSFMHEVAHYECYTSPVGIAISMLDREVQGEALSAYQNGGGRAILGHHQLLDKRAAFHASVALLTSISEGLAQYAEFDLIPTTRTPKCLPLSGVFSSEQSLIDFQLQRIKEGSLDLNFPELQRISGDASKLFGMVDNAIRSARVQQECIATKKRLLTMGEITGDFDYLDGYTFFKTLKIWIGGKSAENESLNDVLLKSEPMYLYLLWYFFKDWVFAQKIYELKDNMHGEMKLLTYFQQRIQRLWLEVDSDDIADLTAWVYENGVQDVSKGYPEFDVPPGLLLDRQEQYIAQEALNEAWLSSVSGGEYLAANDVGKTLQAKKLHVGKFQAHQVVLGNLVYIASEEVDVKIDEQRNLVAQSDALRMQVKALPDAVEGSSGEGTIDWYWYPYHEKEAEDGVSIKWLKFAFFSIDGRHVATGVEATTREPAKIEEALSLVNADGGSVFSARHLFNLENYLDNLVEGAVEGISLDGDQEWQDQFINFHLEKTSEIIRSGIFTVFDLLRHPIEEHVYNSGGIAAVLRLDEEKAERLCVDSLIIGSSGMAEQVEHIFQSIGKDLSEEVAFMEEVGKNSGFPVLMNVGGRIFSSLM